MVYVKMVNFSAPQPRPKGYKERMLGTRLIV